MNDFISAIIRTLVPLGVGALATWLISIGINIEQTAYDGLQQWIMLTITALYYAAVRAAEQRFPWVGWLLGLAKQPVYIKQGEAAIVLDASTSAAKSVTEVGVDTGVTTVETGFKDNDRGE